MEDVNGEWRRKVSNISQIGGIETSVLDSGAGRGTRIAWVNTGSPLRYRVLADRAMDICDAFYSDSSLAWISHRGVSAPDPSAVRGKRWLETFCGGLLTTCGLSHIGGPERDRRGERGQHGRISNAAAELLSVEGPQLQSGRGRMALRGIVRESSVFGARLELHRTISSELGRAEIRITDKVVNCGNEAAAHMLLYHCNFGYPLADAGARLLWKGKARPAGRDMDELIFGGGGDCKLCPGPLDEHRGAGEACGFIDPVADEDGLCRAGIANEKLNLQLTLRFSPRQLPCLTNWQHWGPGEYVTALEPGTNHPVGQAAARERGELIMLEPGEGRHYELVFSVGAIGGDDET